MKKLALLLVFVLFSATAFATALEKAGGYTYKKAAQSPVDEAFFGLKSPDNVYDPYHKYGVEFDNVNGIPGAEPMRNSTYAFGVTEVGNEIWFGVMNNAWCGWMVSHIRLSGTDGMQFKTDHQACGGDGRGTQLYVYNTDNHKITTIDPSNEKMFKDPALADQYRKYFNDTTAQGPRVRAAGNLNGIVFFAGQMNENQGAGDQKDFELIFAFNAETKEYLGNTRLPYNSTRRLNVLTDSQGNQGLYVFFGGDLASAGLGHCRSAMWRWVGTKENPFKGGTKLNSEFELVTDGSGTVETGWELLYTFPIEIGAPGEFLQFKDKEGKDRVIVSTWATAQETVDWWWDDVASDAEKAAYGNKKPEPQAGTLFMSSIIPVGGFRDTNGQRPEFIELMNMSDFEVDPIVAKGYELGAMRVFQGHLMWGTMHVGLSAGYKRYIEERNPDATPKYPGLDEYKYILPKGLFFCSEQPGNSMCVKDHFGPYIAVAAELHPDYNSTFAASALINTWRAIAIFRTKLDFGEADFSKALLKQKMFDNTDLLYGKEKEKVLVSAPANKNEDGVWEEKANLRAWKPLFGESGLGNVLNVYTWMMRVHNNKLYIGTFDLIGGMADFEENAWKTHYDNGTIKYEGVTPSMLQLHAYAKKVNDNSDWGADLFVFDSPNVPAKIVTTDGFGNKWNNGFRNSAVVNGKFFLGTSTYSVLTEDGGIEFYELSDGTFVDTSSSSGGCSVGSGSDYVLFALLVSCVAILAFRRIRKA